MTLGFTFGEAIEAMQQCKKVARKGWSAKDIFCAIQRPGSVGNMAEEYIYIATTKPRAFRPPTRYDRPAWLASQTDMLANDWHIFLT